MLSPDSGFRVKFLRICGSYDESGSRFYPDFGPEFRILIVRKFGLWIFRFPRKSHFLSFMCRMPRSEENLKHLCVTGP